jgi:hypothetical protein
MDIRSGRASLGGHVLFATGFAVGHNRRAPL